jgi:hypothetical protein
MIENGREGALAALAERVAQLEETLGILISRLLPKLQDSVRRSSERIDALSERKDRLPYRKRSYAAYCEFHAFRAQGRSIRASAYLCGLPYSTGYYYERASPAEVARLKAAGDAPAKGPKT